MYLFVEMYTSKEHTLQELPSEDSDYTPDELLEVRELHTISEYEINIYIITLPMKDPLHNLIVLEN